MNLCEICGNEAPYFIDTFNPMKGTHVTYRFCGFHQARHIRRTERYIEEARRRVNNGIREDE